LRVEGLECMVQDYLIIRLGFTYGVKELFYGEYGIWFRSWVVRFRG
jgi:hypothetical protein